MFIRDVILPVNRKSIDREKLTGVIFGDYIPFPKSASIEDVDRIIDNILAIRTEHLVELFSIRNSALYVDISGNHLVSPSAMLYEIKTLENIVWLLTLSIKSEFMIFSKALQAVKE